MAKKIRYKPEYMHVKAKFLVTEQFRYREELRVKNNLGTEPYARENKISSD